MICFLTLRIVLARMQPLQGQYLLKRARLSMFINLSFSSYQYFDLNKYKYLTMGLMESLLKSVAVVRKKTQLVSEIFSFLNFTLINSFSWAIFSYQNTYH